MKKIKYYRGSLASALVFSCIYSLYRMMTVEEQTILRLLVFIVVFVIAFASLLIIFNAADRFSYPNDLQRKPGRFTPVCFATLLIVWGTCFYFCYPGNMMYDTGTSILYSLGIDKSNVNNPFFQNFLFGSVYRLGVLLGDPNRGVAVYCGLQSLAYIALISYLVGQTGGSRAASGALILLYAFVPVFPIYSMTMGKDANFALGVLAFVCLTLKLVNNPDEFMKDRKKPALLAVIVILLGLLRNHAGWFPLAALAGYFFFVWKERRGRIYILALTAAALLFGLGLPQLLGVPKGQVRELLSVPLQQTGYYNRKYGNEVTAEEREVLSKVVSEEALNEYNPNFADPIKDRFKENPSKEDLKGYFSVWFSQLKKHPIAYLKAFYLHTYAYYSPSAISSVKPHTVAGFWADDLLFRETLLSNNTNPGLSLLETMDKKAMSVPVFRLLSGIGLYAWLLAVSIVRLLQKKRYAELLCFSAPVMIFVGCLFSPVNGYYRYAFPMIVCVPILFVYAMQLEEKSK